MGLPKNAGPGQIAKASLEFADKSPEAQDKSLKKNNDKRKPHKNAVKWFKSTNFRLVWGKLPKPTYLRPNEAKRMMTISDLPKQDQPAEKYQKGYVAKPDAPRTQQVGKIRMIRHS